MKYASLVFLTALVLALTACGKDRTIVKTYSQPQGTEKITVTLNADFSARLAYAGGNSEYRSDQVGTWETNFIVTKMRFADGTTAQCCYGSHPECQVDWDCNFSSFGSREFH